MCFFSVFCTVFFVFFRFLYLAICDRKAIPDTSPASPGCWYDPGTSLGHPGTKKSPHTGPRHHRRHHDDRYFGSRWQLAPGSWWRLEGLLSGLDLRSSWCPRRWRGPAPWFPGVPGMSPGHTNTLAMPGRCPG